MVSAKAEPHPPKSMVVPITARPAALAILAGSLRLLMTQTAPHPCSTSPRWTLAQHAHQKRPGPARQGTLNTNLCCLRHGRNPGLGGQVQKFRRWHIRATGTKCCGFTGVSRTRQSGLSMAVTEHPPGVAEPAPDLTEKLENESRRRDESGQNRRRGIEDRATDEPAFSQAIQHGLAGGAGLEKTGQFSVRLQLAGKGIRRDLACAIEQNEIVGPRCRPPCSQR